MFRFLGLFIIPIARLYRWRGVLAIGASGTPSRVTGCGGGSAPTTATPAASLSNIGTRRADIDTFLNSVVFLK